MQGILAVVGDRFDFGPAQVKDINRLDRRCGHASVSGIGPANSMLQNSPPWK